MTTSLSSSIDILSLTSSTTWAGDSPSDEDEIVWSLSSSAVLSSPSVVGSPRSETADVVLVPRADPSSGQSLLPSAEAIAEAMATLSLNPMSRSMHIDRTAPAPAPAPGTTSASSRSPSPKKKQRSPSKKATLSPPHERTPSPPERKKKAKKAKKAKGASPAQSKTDLGASASATPMDDTPSKRTERKRKAAAGAAPTNPTERPASGLGSRTVVDDVSEAGDEPSSGYHEARKYLAHPAAAGNNGSALQVLHALILELGLPGVAGKFSIAELPRSLRKARAMLKSQVFINVRDYLAVREQGQAALQRAMHPSRSSLVKEVRKGKRMPVREVKEAGLNVLLINTRG
ncbi:hypothetical protein BC834DRAFT_971688 [Gloeopeniophorella convolvens]|nr:hypothetical protein BC834DRAFT_971688 [Gloeopeniophorella convolvens]